MTERFQPGQILYKIYAERGGFIDVLLVIGNDGNGIIRVIELTDKVRISHRNKYNRNFLKKYKVLSDDQL